jgi:hypothetical protein
MKKLGISFSGGRTSAVMTKLCVEKYKDTHEIVVTFANTGCEHEKTLEFVDKCDKHFGWGVVWLEAVVNPLKGKGVRHKVVDFTTASRKGEPFEAYIAKYGMPDRNHNHCTSRLKEDVMYSYRREIGWGRNDYFTAIGIRADEVDRVSSKRLEKNLIYPLVDWGWTKEDVKRECASWPFDLDLKGEHYGNCVWCWKKSLRKLMTLAKDDASVFDFPERMESLHEWTNNTDSNPRRFFRGRKSVVDIVEMARMTYFEPYEDEPIFEPHPELDFGSSCGESCEIGADYE